MILIRGVQPYTVTGVTVDAAVRDRVHIRRGQDHAIACIADRVAIHDAVAAAALNLDPRTAVEARVEVGDGHATGILQENTVALVTGRIEVVSPEFDSFWML